MFFKRRSLFRILFRALSLSLRHTLIGSKRIYHNDNISLAFYPCGNFGIALPRGALKGSPSALLSMLRDGDGIRSFDEPFHTPARTPQGRNHVLSHGGIYVVLLLKHAIQTEIPSHGFVWQEGGIFEILEPTES